MSEENCAAAAGACSYAPCAAASSSDACAPVKANVSRCGLLPTLLLVGTRKGGTTALSNLLSQHPAVQMPQCHSAGDRRAERSSWPQRVQNTMCVWDKEVRFFSRGPNAGVDNCWYRSLYPCVPAESQADLSGRGRAGAAVPSPRVAFDGSPDYLVMPEAQVATMAATLAPRARLIALLRDPADRFYSAYNMGMNERRMGGREKMGYLDFAASLNQMIACAPEGCPRMQKVVSMFFDFGMYAAHLRKYYAAFGRERVMVVQAEEL